jgi:hypothetical protein
MATDRLVVNVADVNGVSLTPYVFAVDGLAGVIAMHARTRNAPSSVMDSMNDDLALAHGVLSEKGIVAVVAVDCSAYLDPIGALEARLKGYFAHVRATFRELPKMRLLFEPSNDLKKRYGTVKMRELVAAALALDRASMPHPNYAPEGPSCLGVTAHPALSMYGTNSTVSYQSCQSYSSGDVAFSPVARCPDMMVPVENVAPEECETPPIPLERESEEDAKFRYFRTPSPW